MDKRKRIYVSMHPIIRWLGRLISLVGLLALNASVVRAGTETPPVGESVSLANDSFVPLFSGCAVGNEVVSPVRADFEQRVVELVNDYRATKGLPPLKRVPALDLAARYHARDMRVDNYFNHDSYDGTTMVCKWSERLTAFYTNWNWLGENIAAGYVSPEKVMEGWLNSPGHRANIESVNYWEIGVGWGWDLLPLLDAGFWPPQWGLSTGN